MRLTKGQILVVSFLLFSLFFGAGNLIFPPFLGSQAGSATPIAIIGFLTTAVVLPVLGVIVIAKFGGLDKLASKVNSKFAVFFTILILVSIGPGLGIPRAASVPFEMAIMPYLNPEWNMRLFLLLYSVIFFLIAMWLSLSPTKLPSRVGHFLTPALLILLVALFIAFLVKGNTDVVGALEPYESDPFFKGFNEGYQTMDAIAALNFGLVIATTLTNMGVKEEKKMIGYTVKTGIFAGLILSCIYLMLSYMGMKSSGLYPDAANGAVILRGIVKDVFGDAGAIILAVIFTLACLTTCVGLITSISKYFSDLFKKVSYKQMVIIITLLSTVICNFGLNTILSISIPVLNAIYPVSIMLILLGLFNKFYDNNKIIYPLTITLVGIISIIHAIYTLVPMGAFGKALEYILGFNIGFGWVTFAILGIVISVIVDLILKHRHKKADALDVSE